ncbi:elongation factor P maturation arginine rhamnosyltransferase EarP, partial [Bacillus sp. S70]|uniref:elongation factor P maturation arginine rhamnosyltransferase EarP n=1 Tax=Bacillus sp. S70 TaxID=1226988 RepID=UPI00190D3A4B
MGAELLGEPFITLQRPSAVRLLLEESVAAEHGQAVRLWVDEPQAFARICPRADPAAHVQCLDGVEVRAWGRPW